MKRALYCSSCGELLSGKRPAGWPRRAICGRCPRQFNSGLWSLVGIVMLISAAAFGIGRYTAPREPFLFIGTPAGVASGHAAPSDAPILQLRSTHALDPAESQAS